MKKLFNWLGGFFSSDSNNSSKRLVGIVGAFFLFWTLWDNSHSETHIAPAESLVYCVTTLVAVSLGLTTIESVAHIVKSFKNGGSEPEPTKE
jgi:hypothetical protein